MKQLNDFTSLEFDGLVFMMRHSFPLYIAKAGDFQSSAVDAFSCLQLLFDFSVSRLFFGTGIFVSILCALKFTKIMC